MSHFEETKALFEKMGSDIRITSDKGHINVMDSEGKKAEFTFDENGMFSKTGYFTEED